MKKFQKNIGITFFSLLAFTFLLLFIYKIASISVLAEAFAQSETAWSYIILWFLEIGLSIAIFIIALLNLISLVGNKQFDEKNAARKNCLCLAISSAVFVFGEILVLINELSMYDSGSSYASSLSFPIIFIVLQALICITLFFAASKSENMIVNRIFGVVGYIVMFLVLILITSSLTTGIADGLLLILVFLFFFVDIIGIVHIATCDIHFENTSTKQNEQNLNQTNISEKVEKPMSELECRLTDLKDLYEKDLITEEDYNEKRKQIIDKL